MLLQLKAAEEKVQNLREQVSVSASSDALLQSKDQQINDLEEKLNEESEKNHVS